MIQDEKLTKLIDERIKKTVPEYLKSSAFVDRKLTDNPTDALQVVNRKFITQNGTTAGRPTSSIVGLRYFDTTLGYPVYWSGVTWVDSTGTPV